MTFKLKICFIGALLISMTTKSQNEIVLTKKELRKNRPTYLGITLGTSLSSFRDFSTSPHIYYGATGSLSLSRIKIDEKRESEIGFNFSSGSYSVDFNNHIASSSVSTLYLYYSQLYRLNKLSSNNLNVKVGGLFNTTGNFRLNEYLLNNVLGVEIFPTLFGSIKIEKDVSRKETKNKKILFIKYKLKQRTRNLAFRLNVGLINSNYRNGYSYLSQSEIINEPNIFEDYQYNMFSGFRMSSALDYTISLNNKNAIQLSYLWDAYKSGEQFDKFEMAHHTLKITLLFNTNNK